MHRALRIPELVDLTLSEFKDCVLDFDFDGRTALARSARTCTAWKEIALRILWREVRDMLPLFSLLAPMDVKDTEEDPDEIYEWVRPSGFLARITILTIIIKLLYSTSPNPSSRKQPGIASSTIRPSYIRLITTPFPTPAGATYTPSSPNRGRWRRSSFLISASSASRTTKTHTPISNPF